jgi:poly(3-hydroxybutyrate) depolymerase
VLNMHGSGSTAAAQDQFTGMDATADASGFIVAYPHQRWPK